MFNIFRSKAIGGRVSSIKPPPSEEIDIYIGLAESDARLIALKQASLSNTGDGKVNTYNWIHSCWAASAKGYIDSTDAVIVDSYKAVQDYIETTQALHEKLLSTQCGCKQGVRPCPGTCDNSQENYRTDMEDAAQACLVSLEKIKCDYIKRANEADNIYDH